MPAAPLSDAACREALAALDEHGSQVAAARALGISRNTFCHRIRVARARELGNDAPPPQQELTEDYRDDAGALSSVSPSIRTLDDLLAAANVDLDVWEVDRHIIKKWEVGAKVKIAGRVQVAVTPLWGVEARLRPRKTQDVEHVLARFTDRLLAENRCPPTPPTRRRTSERHLMELALYDAHFGKLAWAQETGEDYDLDIARHLYTAAAEDLLTLAGGRNIAEILLPVGNDFLHVDNFEGTTAKGTRQDVDTRLPKLIEAGCTAVKRVVDRCLTMAPVRILWVRGNHDPLLSYFLCRELAAWYSGSKHVHVDVTPRPRKMVRWGRTMLCFAHGDEEPIRDLPTVMATEWPHDWAATTCREFHLGHLHKKKEMRHVTADSYGGVVVRMIPSLCGTDYWHYLKGYVGGRRVAEAYLYGEHHGYVGHFSSHAADDLLQENAA